MYLKNIVYLKGGLVLNLELTQEDTIKLNKSFVDGTGPEVINVVDHSPIDDGQVDALAEHLKDKNYTSLGAIKNVLNAFGMGKPGGTESNLYHIKKSEIMAIIESGSQGELEIEKEVTKSTKKASSPKKPASRRTRKSSTKK